MRDEELRRFIPQLPRVPGIQGRHRYFNSAVIIPLLWQQSEYHLLFQVRAKEIRQGDEICFPGGAFDADLDESFTETALRETEEELGLDRSQVEVIGRLDTLVVPMGTAIEPHLGLLNVTDLSELRPDPREVARIFTLPVSYFREHDPEVYSVRVEVHPVHVDDHGQERVLLPAAKLGLPERYHAPWGGKEMPIFVYQTQEGVIWGMTAELLRDLTRYLRLF